MKTRKRIIGNREQSNENVPMSSLWYFNEDSVANLPLVREKKTGKHDSLKVANEKKEHLVSIPPERNIFKRENSFVVDWQLSDNF
jgi:hypothetical protein